MLGAATAPGEVAAMGGDIGEDALGSPLTTVGVTALTTADVDG